MADITLNDSQFKDLLKEFNAKKSNRQLLTKDEMLAISKRLGEKISLPFLDQQNETQVLVKMVIRIDSYLYDNLPNEIYRLIHDLDQGFDESEAALFAARLSKQAGGTIRFPFLTEHLEYYSIVFMVNLLVNAMREGSNIDHAIKVSQHPRMMGDDFPYPDLL